MLGKNRRWGLSIMASKTRELWLPPHSKTNTESQVETVRWNRKAHHVSPLQVGAGDVQHSTVAGNHTHMRALIWLPVLQNRVRTISLDAYQRHVHLCMDTYTDTHTCMHTVRTHMHQTLRHPLTHTTSACLFKPATNKFIFTACIEDF